MIDEIASLQRLLRVFTYRPGWTFSIEQHHLVIRAMVIDTDDHKQMTPLSFIRRLPRYVNDDFDWPRWLLNQVLEVEDHEAREFFKIDGIKVFDPHG